jgi:hypothetical protein
MILLWCIYVVFILRYSLLTLYLYLLCRFDDDGNGYINVSEFVLGFKELAKSNGSMVDRISQLVGEDNVII